ncbi:hypothetical protein K4L44_14720 [Halosquirtibacter laminarini]|uniref:Uncharacterized protein n=1 Tax=Halosquirtibacter laminarini TaxID=3374600 RepID=A0AC61NE02_9BACT|nr:hypothetical protein K4L44_14720 [Prolixibacteraceae bacterium]
MKKVLWIALLCVSMLDQVSAQDDKTFVSIESGTTLDLSDPQFSGDNNFDTKLCPGFYFRLYFNQVLSEKLTLREGVGYNIARTYEENYEIHILIFDLLTLQEFRQIVCRRLIFQYTFYGQ